MMESSPGGILPETQAAMARAAALEHTLPQSLRHREVPLAIRILHRFTDPLPRKIISGPPDPISRVFNSVTDAVLSRLHWPY